MKNFNLAVEKGKRYLVNGEVLSFYFIATEFIFNKSDIISGNYHFEFKNNDKIFYTQSLNINVEKRSVLVENSHEDPLIESDNHFFICGQLTENLIRGEYENIDCYFYHEKKIIRQQKLSNSAIKNLFLLKDWKSEVIENTITTKEDCIVRVHLGKKDSTYYEEQFRLKKEDNFDFSKYLLFHEYVAVQCSYEKNLDVEEKHVLKGLKGIFNSKYYFNQELFIPMIPFSEKYTIIENKNWINIENISQLIDYYKEFPEDAIKTFEMEDKFLIPYYKSYKTSSVGKIYSIKNSKKYHIDSNTCKECNVKSKCMQLVPSGLSEMLFKTNLMVESFKNCSINKIINKE